MVNIGMHRKTGKREEKSIGIEEESPIRRQTFRHRWTDKERNIQEYRWYTDSNRASPIQNKERETDTRRMKGKESGVTSIS